MAPTWVSDMPLVQSPPHQDVPERQLENQRPQVTMWERDVSGDGQEPGRRVRSLGLQGSQALSQQAELISRQLQELRRLEDEVRVLRETSLQQKMRLEAQAMELEALARAEKAGQAEAEGLRAALAGAEVVRKNLEEGSQRELEEVQRLHQEQLSSLTQAHQEALSSLTSKAEGLEKSLNGLESRRAGEAKELAAAQREVELLRKQLRQTQEDLEAQVTLVESLRKYVGEQAPPEVHSQTWEPERQELLETVQHLQEDRAGLSTATELLQVRVQSLTHILALQEEELTRKEKVFTLMVQLKAQELEHRDAVKQLEGQKDDRSSKLVLSVTTCRHTVVHQAAEKLLTGLWDKPVAELQEQVTVQSQELAILQHSLQDRATEVEVERVGAKALQAELSRAQEAQRRQQQQAALAEEQLKLVIHVVSSQPVKPMGAPLADIQRISVRGLLEKGHGSVVCNSRSTLGVWLQSTVAKMEEAAARLPSLSNRLSYAVRKVHTIQGLMARKLALAQLRQESCPAPPSQLPPAPDMSLELQQLREERNRLDAELQLSAHLIQQEVGRVREQGEAERQQLSKVAQQLEQELQQAQESLASVGLQLAAARQGQQESTEEAASLGQELTQQQEVYGQALQEKVAEVEARLREQLSDTERRLNEAQREHAKAVVSLRQVQRKATREKQRDQELRRLQDEARKEEGQRLTRRVQELEKDKNLMLATLQQEGLLSRYKQQRLLAVLPSPPGKEKLVESSPQPPESSASVPPTPAVLTRASLKGSLSVLLDDLQGLSEAIAKEEAICQGSS
ncbi:Coiled-coil alpha-helical rod protein 1 [Tupaia chinensis]|uniref:Coiled-coil alpha-helical rod protein 1 n=1 Tax=Tupaia chinensis TaxID=246437 RepID=L9KZB6_TUPCH|nr:Coiled-coil alpha-helical rod protein 1 [Tupaia chinensis]